MAGRALQMAVRTTGPVEKEVKNPKTGVMEKKKLDEHAWKFFPITLKRQAVETAGVKERA